MYQIAGRQKLVYETQTPEDDIVQTLLGVNYEPKNVQGAAIEIQRIDLTEDAGDYSHVTTTILTVPEAIKLIEHLTIAINCALAGDEDFAEPNDD